MSDQPTMPRGDDGMPPGVSVRDIPGEDKSPAIRRAGLWRRLEEILSDERREAIQWFVDDVLGSLQRMGVDTSDCDGDEAPQVILSGWIFARLEAARLQMEDVASTTSLWDAHAIAHNALKSESLGGGGLGRGENASPKEATDNDASERQRGGNGDA